MYSVFQAIRRETEAMCCSWKHIAGKAEKEGGQGLVEYAVIMMLLALACIGGLTLFGGSVVEMFNRIRSGIP